MNQQGDQLIVWDIKWKTIFIYKVEVALVSRDIFSTNLLFHFVKIGLKCKYYGLKWTFKLKFSI